MGEMLGCTEEELAQIDPTHPDDREEGARLFRELVEGKRESYQREKGYIRKDGRIIGADLTTAAIRDETRQRQMHRHHGSRNHRKKAN
jgi:PAS domain S-box-containing protein